MGGVFLSNGMRVEIPREDACEAAAASSDMAMLGRLERRKKGLKSPQAECCPIFRWYFGLPIGPGPAIHQAQQGPVEDGAGAKAAEWPRKRLDEMN